MTHAKARGPLVVDRKLNCRDYDVPEYNGYFVTYALQIRNKMLNPLAFFFYPIFDGQ